MISATSALSLSPRFKSTTSVRESRVPRVAEEMVIEEEVVLALKVLVVAAAAVVAEEEASETEVVLDLRMPMVVLSEVAETRTMAVEEMALLRKVREFRPLRTARRDATTEAEVLETTRVVLVDLRVVLPVEVAKETAAREAVDALTTLVSVPRRKVMIRMERESVLLALTEIPLEAKEVVPTPPRRLPSPRNELQYQLFDLPCHLTKLITRPK